MFQQIVRIDVRATSKEILRTYYRHQHREMSLNEVAQLTECSERTVVRHIQWLRRFGYLTDNELNTRSKRYSITELGIEQIEER